MGDLTLETIRRAVACLFTPGDTVEVRVPKAGRAGTIAGYFSDLDKLADAVERLNRGGYPGVYWTINPVDSALLARYPENRTVERAQKLTAEENILCWRRFAIDLDPKRPSGISATDAQHEAALAAAARLYDELCGLGWPAAIRADSGNGAHLVFGIDLPNDGEAKDLVRRVLQALATRVAAYPADGIQIDVDLSMAKPAQICKCWGTWARKGQNTTERPHRQSRLLEAPQTLEVVRRDLLEQMAGPAQQRGRMLPMPASQRGAYPAPRESFDLRRFLDEHGVRYGRALSYKGGTKYQLDECPFDSSHKSPDSAVFEFSDGFAFKCLHNSCTDYGWADFREHFEPGYKERRERGAFWRSAARSEGHDSGIPLPEEPTDLTSTAESDTETGRDTPGPEGAPLPLSVGDVEAAIDATIEAGDLPAAMRLIPDIARMPAQTQALIVAKLRLKFKRDFPAREFTRAVKAMEEELNQQNAPVIDEDDMPPADAPDLLDYPLTDSGNGERILSLYGEDIRFCPEFKKWMMWDGKRWKVDTDAATITQKAKNMARLLYRQAAVLQDSDRRKLLQAWARDSENQASISAALLRAKSEPGMQISATDLDKHRYLLNCLNGVVDVRSGELLPFDRHYYVTKMCHVRYNPDSKPEQDCPRFLKMLHWAMGETPDMAELPERVTRMVAFLQKAFGYAVTGDVSEKAAFIFYGAKGNNGKTTLLTIFKHILAEYATQLDINTLMTSKFTDNNVRADLAKLHGARFVITSEVDDGQRLSERLMKYLTAGMGEITACRKFENPFEFPATHKIWMDCNYRPEIKGADEAIWSRLKCVPFLQRIDKNDPELDKQLLEKILAESEGVLAWAVRGAMRWAKDGGLGDPPEVTEAVAQWRDDDDPLKGFFEECCEVDPNDPDCYCRCRDFTAAYQVWCKDNNEPQMKSSRLTQRLLLKGIKLNRSRRISDAGKQARCWDGVRLREDVTQAIGARGGRFLGEKDF